MIEGLVERLLLRRPRTRAAMVGWAVFLAAFPLAYLGGSILEQRVNARNGTVVPVDRDGAIATAQQFAADHGIDTAKWSAYATLDASDNLMKWYALHHDGAAAAARKFSPAITTRVLLYSKSGGTAQVYLDQDGRVSGFDFTQVKALTAAASVPEAEAEAAARAPVEKIPQLQGLLVLGKADTAPIDQGKGCRSFTWKTAADALPGLDFEIVSAVCGVAPARSTVTATVNSKYAKAHWGRATRPLTLLQFLYGLYMTVVVIYSIYRYVRRSVEREVSHARTLWLGVAIGAAMSANFVSALDEYVAGVSAAGQGVIWFPMIFAVIGFLLLGLAVAVTYGAGEGDLRELYPGKMTSLDTLLRGRIFSRNVGRSAVFGTAYAAWMLLAAAVAHLLMGPATFSSQAMKVPFFRAPAIALFLGQAIIVTIIPASGLLLPLAFLGRKVRRPRVRTVLMVIFAWLGCLSGVVVYGSLDRALVGTAVLSATLLGAFFGMDLLAVIIGVGALQVSTSMTRLMALSPAWPQLGVAVSAVGLCFLVAELRAALQGREFREDEVRPVYAGNILSRQQMQAELAAAREAQLHMLPRSVPEVLGLYISAACVPARTVGGDFYDFYPLGDGRLGIFIAEGGNRGIGSALNIALAKGYLMHTVRRNLSPREVIQRLETTLGPLLEGVGTHVAYAVIDTASGTIRYARTGEYPRVVVASALSGEQKFEIPGTGTVVYEGSANLRTGDTVLLFTDGIARRVRTSGPGAADSILKALARKRKEHELEDDLTAVVVRVTRANRAMEVVA